MFRLCGVSLRKRPEPEQKDTRMMKRINYKLGGLLLALVSITAAVSVPKAFATASTVTMCFAGTVNVQVLPLYVPFFEARGYTLGPCNVTPNTNN